MLRPRIEPRQRAQNRVNDPDSLQQKFTILIDSNTATLAPPIPAGSFLSRNYVRADVDSSASSPLNLKLIIALGNE